jgi:septum formation protein
VRTTERPRLILASASPARLKLLRSAGFQPDVIVSGVDEEAITVERADELCLTLARLKADAVVDRVSAASGPGTLVLGCDSVLEFDGEVLGKPASAQDATRRWQRMRGRSGVLHTGHSLVEVSAGQRADAVTTTVVHFAEVTDAEVAAYVATGEPLQVAGAFTIDGIGGPFVDRIDGDHGTVVGVSLPRLRLLLAELGFTIPDLWSGAPT